MTVPANKAFCDLWLKEFKEMPDHDEEVIWSETVLLLLAMDKAGTAGDGTMEGLMKIMNALRGLNWVCPRVSGYHLKLGSNPGTFEAGAASRLTCEEVAPAFPYWRKYTWA